MDFFGFLQFAFVIFFLFGDQLFKFLSSHLINSLAVVSFFYLISALDFAALLFWIFVNNAPKDPFLHDFRVPKIKKMQEKYDDALDGWNRKDFFFERKFQIV